MIFFFFFFALVTKCSINRLGSLNQELSRKEMFHKAFLLLFSNWELKHHKAALPHQWGTNCLKVWMCEFGFDNLPRTVISINEGSRWVPKYYFIPLLSSLNMGSTEQPLWLDSSYQYEIKTGFNVFPEGGIPPFSRSHHHVSSAVHLIRWKTSRSKSFNINGALCRTRDRGSALNSS